MDSVRTPMSDPSGEVVKTRFVEFLQRYSSNSSGANGELDHLTNQQKLMIDYVAQILTMIQNNKSTVYVDFTHIIDTDSELAEAIELEYYRFEPYLRAAIQDIVNMDNQHYVYDVDKGQREFFVAFYNMPNLNSIRQVKTDCIGKLIAISGTVTRSSEVRPELLYGTFACFNCGTMYNNVEQQFQYTEPKVCKNVDCGSQSRFNLLMDKSAFVDWQRLRVQENADEIPPGSMPRCIDVICRNEIVELAKAGDKVVFVGSVAVSPDASGLARAGEASVAGKSGGRSNDDSGGVTGLKQYGARELTYKIFFNACSIQPATHAAAGSKRMAINGESGLLGPSLASVLPLIEGVTTSEEGGDKADVGADLTEAEVFEIYSMRNDNPFLYNTMVESVCPQVWGHPEVKRGILLMLFGGVHKITTDGGKLRGDINVCIVGDPSCAKSQFLKYIHEFWPRSVYTSGKSSSAAGLTASVVRDADTGEFCVEAGALMLADNGICCIDEFDKMDPQDQVAIHEAMEQQTISITKAGIQATLNARTAILAAANPVFGRYDRTKTLKANVTISAPIMSRFDLFFVILDECNPKTDEAIARHIIENHMIQKTGVSALSGKTVNNETGNKIFTSDQLRRYIRFAKSLNPVLTEESAKVLTEKYRLLRGNDLVGKNRTAYRITVRQLESLIRLSEALARLHLDQFVQPMYVKEAYRLLQKSIIFVETEDVELEDNEREMNETTYNSSHSGNNSGESNSSNGGSNMDDGNNNADNTFDSNSNSNRNGNGDVDNIDGGNLEADGLAGQQTEAGVTTEMKKEKSSGKKKDKVFISSREYDAITNMLSIRLASLERNALSSADIAGDEQSSSSSSAGGGEGEEGGGNSDVASSTTAGTDNISPVTGEFIGCLWKDLVLWYLEQKQDEIQDVEKFESMKKMVSQVIRRMIKHEGSIIVMEDNDDNDQKRIKLHPSYQI